MNRQQIRNWYANTCDKWCTEHGKCDNNCTIRGLCPTWKTIERHMPEDEVRQLVISKRR
jgi:hypothetical protein